MRSACPPIAAALALWLCSMAKCFLGTLLKSHFMPPLLQTLEEQAQRRQQELGKIQKEVETQKAKQQEGIAQWPEICGHLS